jgi:hypothetical protein
LCYIIKPAIGLATENNNSSAVDRTEAENPNDSGLMANTNGSNGLNRPSLMSKIKGEVKILQGKISKNEEKVQEGRRLKLGV